MASLKCNRCTHEGDWTSFVRCSRCKLSIYCSNECQVSDWQTHKSACTPAQLQQLRSVSHKISGVTVACNADRARGARAFEARIIDPSHPIHAQGVLCPLFQQVGFPLLLIRHIPDDPATMMRDPGLDNQIAAHLMMHPNIGHPEETWQKASCIGTVTVMRQDGNSLSFEAIETALMYVDHLIAKSREGESPTNFMNSAGFQRFCQRYKDEKVSTGNTMFEKMSIPL